MRHRFASAGTSWFAGYSSVDSGGYSPYFGFIRNQFEPATPFVVRAGFVRFGCVFNDLAMR
ncbi:hypothetical protein SPHINGOR109_10273 [Sphingorhabdus sp. 109]|jgi:hypothetical protein|nr:hypothetical protein SPHINGOR109_10273 [Sphingorhabdus sp. 109]